MVVVVMMFGFWARPTVGMIMVWRRRSDRGVRNMDGSEFVVVQSSDGRQAHGVVQR
jgi:hypothetical protein